LLSLFFLQTLPSGSFSFFYGFLVTRDFYHTQRRATIGRTPLGRAISSSQRLIPDNTQHSQPTNIHAPSEIPTHDRSRRAAVGLRLRPRDHLLHGAESFLRSYGLQLSKKFPVFYETRKFVLHSQLPSTCLYPEPAQSSPYPTSHFLKIHLNIILPSTPGYPQWSLSFRLTHQNPIHAPLSSPSTLHAPLISFFSILSPTQYWVRSTDHEVPHYDVFFTPLLPCPSWTQIFSLTPYSQTPSAYVSPSMSATKFHTHKNNRQNYSFVYRNLSTDYGLDGPMIESRWDEIFHTRPDRTWGPPYLLYNGYRAFLGVKVAGAWC
jgi:hypothetical protein